MYEKGFDYLLKNGNEVIIYGVLKHLHLARQMSDFEDLVEEGKLAFVVAYDEYVKKVPVIQDEKPLNAYIYQRVKWKIIDILRKEQKYRLHFENMDDEAFFTLLVSEKNDCLVDKFGNAEILSKLWDRCTENEKKYLRICLNHDLSITEIAKCLKVSRKTVYNYRSKILIKYENLSD